jgi:hypothetical protein
MNDRLPTILASLALARQALVRLHALAEAGERPDAAALGAVMAPLDAAAKELEALAKRRPFRVLPGGRGRDER